MSTGPSRLRLLTFTTLYPNTAQPQHGVFVENRLRHLVATGEVELRVVAPVPWFPFKGKRFGAYALFARASKQEVRNNIVVVHPRYFVLPRIGMLVAPVLLYLGARLEVKRLLRWGFDFDVIDAHYFYPDGVAAAMLSREFKKPFVVTARGTDLNLIPDYPLPRRMIRWTARVASGLITVCAALKVPLMELGIAEDRITVLRNGVDLGFFRPVERDVARGALGEELSSRLLISVGHLISRKGHDLVIRALIEFPNVRLLIAGSGPERHALENLAAQCGVADRVRFLGQLPQERLRDLYSAADALVLASSREGWANVLLEAMACGTPVVASDIWGTPEVVSSPVAGQLMPELSPSGVAQGIRALFASQPERAATRAYAEGFSWEDTSTGQLRLFRAIIGNTKIASAHKN